MILCPRRPRRRDGLLPCLFCVALFIVIASVIFSPAQAEDVRDGSSVEMTTPGGPGEEESTPPGVNQLVSDEYGDVVEEDIEPMEKAAIADPIEPFNRAMYHFNDKFYLWVWKPTAQGYRAILPGEVRGLFGNFYENIKVPVRIFNNLLQGKVKYAGIEMFRFLINSTIGVGGLRDCAKECFSITGRDADFGQTLGKYGMGFGFYIVAPFLGPTSPRDGVGWAVDWVLRPTTYVGDLDKWFDPESVGLVVHEKVNHTSFHIGDYEVLKEAAIDPYMALRDAYVQHRRKVVEDD